LKQHAVPVGRMATLRLLAQRFAFLALVVTSFALMIVGKADIVLIERTRVLVADAVAPILDVMARPAAAIAEVVDNVRDLAALRAENVRLREENARLLHWQTVARQLDNQNKALSSQLNFVPDPDPAFITARVIADTGGAFVHSMLINAGSREGVRKGQAVISGEVLVGRIADVGLRSARILLVTDINSRIPAVVESSRTKAILAGDNTDRPRLNYVSGNPGIAPGDRVVTSGDGNAFPPGMPIGTVASVADGVIRVEPFVHRHQLEFVTIVDYGLAGVLPTTREAQPAGARR
jgi:rod shape-determining protein MreC